METKVTNKKRVNLKTEKILQEMKEATGISLMQLMDMAITYFYKSKTYEEIKKATDLSSIKGE